VSDVVISNLTIECRRHDWFWWGDGDPFHFNIKRRSEVHPQSARPDEPPAGSIRNVLIRNVIARGKGSSVINGHPDSWLEGITLENVKLFLSSDPAAPYDKSVHALKIQRAKNFKLKDVEVVWEKPEWSKWESALYVEDVRGLQLDGFSGRQARPGASFPAVVLNRVEEALIRGCVAPAGTEIFLKILGSNTREIRLSGNDFHQSKVPYDVAGEVRRDELHELSNFMPK